VLVVLACGLIGYGLSLALPLHRAPAPATAITKPEPAKGAEAKPARQDSSYAGSSASHRGRETSVAGKPSAPTPAASADPAARLGRVEPAAAKAPAQASAPLPAVETGSVEHAAQRAGVPPGDKAAARPAETPAAAAPQSETADTQPGAKQAAPRKKVRRVYRRAQPKTAKGPFEQLFPALAK
jgi:hypothetical protein